MNTQMNLNGKKAFIVIGLVSLALCFGNTQGLANEPVLEGNPNLVMERALEKIPRELPFAGGFNPDTGNTTISVGAKDGSRTVTVLDKKGKEIKKEKIPAKRNPFAESYDPKTGKRIRVEGNPDGTRTITETDKDGKKTKRKVDPKDNKRPWAESTDPSTGVTTRVQGNADGSRTITQTNASGNVISSQTIN